MEKSVTARKIKHRKLREPRLKMNNLNEINANALRKVLLKQFPMTGYRQRCKLNCCRQRHSFNHRNTEKKNHKEAEQIHTPNRKSKANEENRWLGCSSDRTYGPQPMQRNSDQQSKVELDNRKADVSTD